MNANLTDFEREHDVNRQYVSTKKTEVENFVDSIVDQVSDQVNTEFDSSPESFGFTQRDVKQGTNKFCLAIVKEIDNRVQDLVKERFN